MLTPEQIQSFNARAEAGETATEGMWDHSHYPGDGTNVYWLRASGIEWSVTAGPNGSPAELKPVACGLEIASAPAAQLAAEELLRRATVGLHRAMVREAFVAGYKHGNVDAVEARGFWPDLAADYYLEDFDDILKERAR